MISWNPRMNSREENGSVCFQKYFSKIGHKKVNRNYCIATDDPFPRSTTILKVWSFMKSYSYPPVVLGGSFLHEKAVNPLQPGVVMG